MQQRISYNFLFSLGLLDPRWREQKNKEIEEKKEQEEVYAPGRHSRVKIEPNFISA